MNAHEDQAPLDPEPTSLPELSARDRKNLGQLEKKLQVLRDRVAGVVKGYQTGCIATGRGGTSKSYTVIETLEAMGASYRLHNTHLTPRGLFDELAQAPDAVHVIEDAEGVLRNPLSVGVLRSATWGNRRGREGRFERLITWKAHGVSREVVFGGGVVILSNRRLGDLPELVALTTRIPTIELPVTDSEVIAMMRSVALKGFQIKDAALEGQECLEVTEFIIRESRQTNRPLDMRVLVNALADRLQADDHDAGCDWRDLVASTLRGRPSVVEAVETAGIRQQKKTRELNLAREIVHLPRLDRLRIWKERLQEWGETRGASEASLYRRLAELGAIDATRFDM